MKIRGQVSPATQRFEFENLKKVREMFEQRRNPMNTEIHHVVSTYSEQVLAHSRSHTVFSPFSLPGGLIIPGPSEGGRLNGGTVLIEFVVCSRYSLTISTTNKKLWGLMREGGLIWEAGGGLNKEIAVV